jgi:hypothetical protein
MNMTAACGGLAWLNRRSAPLSGLHAILWLHTAQEDEAYLSLGEEEAAPGGR